MDGDGFKAMKCGNSSILSISWSGDWIDEVSIMSPSSHADRSVLVLAGRMNGR